MKTIHNGELVSLIRKYLVSVVMENGIVILTKVEIRLDCNLLQLLFSIMLNELDMELGRRGLGFY